MKRRGEHSRAVRTVSTVFAVLVTLAFSAVVARGGTNIPGVIQQHSGNNDPSNILGENWTQLGVEAVGRTKGAVTNDNGTNAWYVEKNGSGDLGYQYVLNSGEQNQITNLAWSVTVNLRVVNTSDTPDYAVCVLFATGTTRFDMLFGSTASGDPIVQLASSFTGNGDNPQGPSYTATGAGSGYHQYKLVYDRVAGNADLFIDGVERISNFAGNTAINGGTSSMFWGATGDTVFGRGNYNFVQVAIPEPGSGTLILLASASILARRRLRR